MFRKELAPLQPRNHQSAVLQKMWFSAQLLSLAVGKAGIDIKYWIAKKSKDRMKDKKESPYARKYSLTRSYSFCHTRDQ
jgi:hypothetical protein